ncbi:MAG: ankyrin repeat domain-containing protein [Pseudomonadota bacterium]
MDNIPAITRTTHAHTTLQNPLAHTDEQLAGMLELEDSVVQKLPESSRKLIRKLFGGASPAITFSRETREFTIVADRCTATDVEQLACDLKGAGASNSAESLFLAAAKQEHWSIDDKARFLTRLLQANFAGAGPAGPQGQLQAFGAEVLAFSQFVLGATVAQKLEWTRYQAFHTNNFSPWDYTVREACQRVALATIKDAQALYGTPAGQVRAVCLLDDLLAANRKASYGTVLPTVVSAMEDLAYADLDGPAFEALRHTPNSNPQRLMLRACAEGDVAKVKRLLAAGLDANEETTYGNTPLVAACLAGHTAVKDVLIASGARIDKSYARGGQTAFWNALISHGYFDLAALLCEQLCPRFGAEAYAGTASAFDQIPPSFHDDLAKIFAWAIDIRSADTAANTINALQEHVENLAAGGKDRVVYQDAAKALQSCLDVVTMHNLLRTMEDSPPRQRLLRQPGFSFTFKPEFNQVFTLTLNPSTPQAPALDPTTVTTLTTTVTATTTVTSPVTGSMSGVSQFVGATHGQDLLDFAVELAEIAKLDLRAAPGPLFAVINFLCAHCGELPPPVQEAMFGTLIPALIGQVKESLSTASHSAESLMIAKMTAQRAVAAPVIHLYVLDGLSVEVRALMRKGDGVSKHFATNLACWAWQNKGKLFAAVSGQAFHHVFWAHCTPLMTHVVPAGFAVKEGLLSESRALLNGADICAEVFQSTPLVPALSLAQPLLDLWKALSPPASLAVHTNLMKIAMANKEKENIPASLLASIARNAFAALQDRRAAPAQVFALIQTLVEFTLAFAKPFDPRAVAKGSDHGGATEFGDAAMEVLKQLGNDPNAKRMMAALNPNAAAWIEVATAFVSLREGRWSAAGFLVALEEAIAPAAKWDPLLAHVFMECIGACARKGGDTSFAFQVYGVHARLRLAHRDVPPLELEAPLLLAMLTSQLTALALNEMPPPADVVTSLIVDLARHHPQGAIEHMLNAPPMPHLPTFASCALLKLAGMFFQASQPEHMAQAFAGARAAVPRDGLDLHPELQAAFDEYFTLLEKHGASDQAAQAREQLAAGASRS